MARNQYCIPCGELGRDVNAVVVIDGDPMCASHALTASRSSVDAAAETIGNTETSVSALPDLEPCRRGCGRPKHRGMCKGHGGRGSATRVSLAATVVELVKAKVEVVKSEECEMDVLVCEEVPVETVPSGQARVLGRMGALWLRLMATPYGTALKVKCRDVDHASHTGRHLKVKAKKAGVDVVSRRVGAEFWCYRVDPVKEE